VGNRQIPGVQSDAKLMRPAGFRDQLDQCQLAFALEGAPVSDGTYRVALLRGRNLDDVLAVVLYQVMDKLTVVMLRHPVTNRHIRFLRSMILKLICQACGGLARARKKDNARYRPIEAMHDTEKCAPRLFEFRFDPFAGNVKQRFILTFVRHNRDAGRLHDSEQVIITVENF